MIFQISHQSILSGVNPKAIVLDEHSSCLRRTKILIEENFNDNEIEIIKQMALNGVVVVTIMIGLLTRSNMITKSII